MIKVPMPPDTNEQVVFCKRTMREAWPAHDDEQFREDLAEINHAQEVLDELDRHHRRSDMLVNIVGVAGLVTGVILLVSGA